MPVKRHSYAAIFMHWFNAVCWILLLATGFGLISNETLQPVAGWWVRFMESVFGGGAGLLTTHVTIAVTWIVVYALFLLLRWKADAWPFLREIFNLSPRTDAVWTVRKGFWLVLGPKAMRRLGMDPNLPPQGFYNAGQKYVAIAAVLCSLGLVVSGAILLYTREPGASMPLAQWLIFIHFLCAGIMAKPRRCAPCSRVPCPPTTSSITTRCGMNNLCVKAKFGNLNPDRTNNHTPVRTGSARPFRSLLSNSRPPTRHCPAGGSCVFG